MTMAAEISPPVARNPRRRLLVVDDEALIRWALTETFLQAGYLVEERGDARTTLDCLVAGYVPDIVLLDFRLPDSTDFELLRAIRCHAPGSLVIMMTAFGTLEMIAEAERVGAARVLSKPVDMTGLPALVDEFYWARASAGNTHLSEP